jgi:type IV conjugative transfer system coupling protein TraD
MSNSKNTAKMFTRGGQITFNNIRMLLQINQKVAQWSILFIVTITVLVTIITTKKIVIYAAYLYYISILLTKLNYSHHIFTFIYNGQTITINPRGVLEEPYFSNQATLFMHNLTSSFYIGLFSSLIFIVALTIWLTKRGRTQANKTYIRGSRIETPKVLSKLIRKHGASNIQIANMPMIKDFEVKHTLIHGTTGSGKGQTFNQFLEQIRSRGDSAIVFDKGCVFTSMFYDETKDIILNPFDARCAHWDLWSESKTEPDFENIAESLIPMHGDADPYWVDAARTVFSSVAYKMRNDEDRSIDKLLRLILTSELDVLGEYLKGTQAAMLVSGKIEKTAISIRSVISTYLKSLRFLEGLENQTPFSIRDWINNIAHSKAGHCLFISSNAEHHAALRPLISMWLSMASISLLSLEENYERRIWFICDELPTLHKLPQLGETIAEVRKFGGCFILGMQSLAQLQKIYGKASAAEMFDLLNTRFFFRSPSSEMAYLVSKELGEEDVEQCSESYSYGANTIRDGISIGTQRTTRALISPSEIMEMPDLTAYVKVPAPVPITKLELQYKARKKVCQGFIIRTHDTNTSDRVSNTKPQVENIASEDDCVESSSKINSSEEIADTSIPVQNGHSSINDIQRQEENILIDDKEINTDEMVF